MTVAGYAKLASVMAGFVGLGVELTAERLLAPAFGTTLDLWSIIIGLTFTALSLGYALGGRIIDRNPSHRFVAFCLLVAGGWTVGIAFLGRPVADQLQVWTFDTGGVTLGIFITVLLLFTLPPFVLGIITPAAIRLTVPQVGEAGSSAGTIFALNTLGSLVGTFTPVLLLMPAIGVQNTFLTVAAVGLVSGAIGLTPLVRPETLSAGNVGSAELAQSSDALD